MSVDKETLDGLRIDRPHASARRSATPWLAIVLGAIVLIAAAAWFLTRGRAIEVQAAQARTVTSSSGGGAVLNATGYVTARRQATVSSKVTGKVTEVLIEEGMRVKAGQELARLDEGYAAKGLTLAQAQASAAASSLEETRVRIRQAQVEYERASRLANDQISSRAELDRTRAEVDALRARLVSQGDSLSVAREQVNLQRQSMDDTVVRAPFDGVVVSKDAQPGEMISPVSGGGGFTRTGICTIVDMDSLEIEVDVSEAYIGRVYPKQRVEAVLDAYPEWRIPGHVITAVPTADRQKATVKVRIAFDQKDARVLPDMGVKVSFITDQPQAAATTIVEIPKGALRRDGESDVVYVIAEGRAARRAVRVAATEGEVVRITSGLTGNEQVVSEGPPELKDGDRVNVKK